MKPTLVLAFTAALLTLPLASPAHEFTSKNGDKLEAEIMAVSGDKVVIKRSDNRTFTVPIATFIDADQAVIEEWRKKDQADRVPNLDISVVSRRSDRSANDGDYDNRSMKLRFKVEVENQERNFDLKDANATLVVLGEDVNSRGRLKVLAKESYKFSAPEGQTATHDGKEVQLKYDDNDSFKFGHKYYGYVLVLQNQAGKTIAVKSIPSGLAKYPDAALELRENADTTRELE